MDDSPLRILLVEDSEPDAELVRYSLRQGQVRRFTLKHVTTSAEAIHQLENEGWQVVLLDLGLCDSQGVECVARICAAAPAVPVIVLTGMDRTTSQLEAVKLGAQDYLNKTGLSPELLWVTIDTAIERHRVRGELIDSASHDGLTGLFN